MADLSDDELLQVRVTTAAHRLNVNILLESVAICVMFITSY